MKLLDLELLQDVDVVGGVVVARLADEALVVEVEDHDGEKDLGSIS
jgi:hypothetical protein